MYQSIRKDGTTIDGLNKIRLKAYDLYKVKISEPEAKKIYGYLENSGIIKPTDSKNTQLLKDRSLIKI